jgi:aldose 1-epimerase
METLNQRIAPSSGSPCVTGTAMISPVSVTEQPYGKTQDGTAVKLYTLRNAQGSMATITNYGGTMTSLKMPDRNGKQGDVVLGYDH